MVILMVDDGARRFFYRTSKQTAETVVDLANSGLEVEIIEESEIDTVGLEEIKNDFNL